MPRRHLNTRAHLHKHPARHLTHHTRTVTEHRIDIGQCLQSDQAAGAHQVLVFLMATFEHLLRRLHGNWTEHFSKDPEGLSGCSNRLGQADLNLELLVIGLSH